MNDRIVYVGECGGRPRKRWIDTMKNSLKKKRVWMSGKLGEGCMAWVCEGECMGDEH